MKRSIAEKFIEKSIKTIEINGISFTFRKLNPTDNFILSEAYGDTRKRGIEKLIAGGKTLKEATKEFKYTNEEIQKIADRELEVCFTRCLLEPKITVMELNDPKRKKDEIPLTLIDAVTSVKLLDAIQEFSLELWEDVSVKKFLKNVDGSGTSGDLHRVEDTPEHASEELQPEDGSITTDDTGHDIHEVTDKDREDKD